MNSSLGLCDEEHDHGHDIFDQTYIPERLINVSSETPRLILRNEILPFACSPEFKYTALSYCWGSGESQAKTTAVTLHDRQASINETELPPVLRDAIRVTRALGIPFLWVDALCILQDDRSDWERQCAEMNNIYGAAHVTLCVANSASCNEGFLQQTVPCIRLPFQSLQAPEVTGSFLVQCNKHLSGSPMSWEPSQESRVLLWDDVGSSIWHQRGWVFQENQLSTRKVIFGSRNLYFECNYMAQARGKHRHSGPCPYIVRPHSVSITFTETNPKVIYDAWNSSILDEYARYNASSFSCVADVLPALSGLARLFGDRLKDAYYAGHWERDLYRSLSWNAMPLRSFAMQPSELILPSWSLLAKGDIDLYTTYLDLRLDLRSEIKVLKARVVTVGENPFGALKECRLWIRGYTLDMSRREVQVLAEPPENDQWGGWHLVVHDYCFGHLSFDWQAGCSINPWTTCPSAEEIRGLKLLLLGSFKGHELTEMPEDERFKNPSIHNDQGSASKESSCDGYETEFEKRCYREYPSDEETSTLSDDDSGHGQYQLPTRQGYGLILSPTGNDHEYRRVGVVFAGEWPNICTPHGDLKALQSLAQMKTIQLV